jgi:dipeptidyl aminopeptidase/acylaminoacyl peptidase
MKPKLLTSLTTCLALLVPSLPLAAAPPPSEAFFSSPQIGDLQLSPAGTQLGMQLRSKDGVMRLAVMDLATMKTKVVAAFDRLDVGVFSWVNDGRLVMELDPPLTGPGLAEYGNGLFAVNADGSLMRQLVDTSFKSFLSEEDHDTKRLPVYTRMLAALPDQDGNEVFVYRAEEISREKIDHFELKRLNTTNGRAKDIEAPEHSYDWTFDAKGDLRVALTRRGDQQDLHWKDADGKWRVLRSFSYGSGDSIHPRLISADGTFYVEAQHRGRTALFRMDPASGKLDAAPLASSDEFDVHPDLIVRKGRLIGLRYAVDAEVTQWLDDGMKALQQRIDALLPATANRVTPALRGDLPFVLVESWADQQPRMGFIFNTEAGKLARLGSTHPAIDRQQMGQTDFVHYKARDGRRIPAYLTLPPGERRTALPLVVLVHGGPWVRGAEWRWDSEVQFLASRGYAVIQPEFRGSTGFGADHFEAGLRQWGQAMQDDLADAALWAVERGTADRKRIAIAGASYGGYAALMGLVKNPEIFRCGISWAGVTDIGLMYSVAWSDATEQAKRYEQWQLIGDPDKDAAMLKAASPLASAAAIKQPLLLAHGAWDVRVPIIHGEKLRDAIRAVNPKLEWVVYDEEGHGWRRPATRVDFWGRVERFLAANLGTQ